MSHRITWSAILAGVMVSTAMAGNVKDELKAKLGLNRCEVFELAAVNPSDGEVVLNLPLGAVKLEPLSIRSADYQAVVHKTDGSTQVLDLPPMTYGGTTQRGARVIASLYDGKLTARIESAAGVGWTIQPARTASASTTTHVAYTDLDAQPAGGVCGNDTPSLVSAPASVSIASTQELTSCEPVVAKLALVADQYLYQAFDNDSTAVVAYLEAVAAGVSAVYEREVGVKIELSQTVVLTNTPFYISSSPTGAVDFNTVLQAFTDWYNSTYPSIDRNAAHLLFGVDPGNGTIGRAWQNVICDPSSGYGINSDRDRLIDAIALVSHELGHNWNAQHCDNDSDCDIMWSSNVIISTTASTFGSASTNAILNSLNGACFNPPVNPDTDCNLNGICDDLEIANGTAPDTNSNNIIDTCERVNNVTSGDSFRNISEAIMAANNGDQLNAAPGVYEEWVNFRGKDLHLTGTAGAAGTIIDVYPFFNSAVTFANGESRDAILEGFTLFGGDDSFLYTNAAAGGGVFVTDTSPTVQDCVIRNTYVVPRGDFSIGAGVSITSAGAPLVMNCLFCENSPEDIYNASGAWGAFFNNVSNPFCVYGDADQDADVDVADVWWTQRCMGNYGSTTPCFEVDFESDVDVTGADWISQEFFFTGP